MLLPNYSTRIKRSIVYVGVRALSFFVDLAHLLQKNLGPWNVNSIIINLFFFFFFFTLQFHLYCKCFLYLMFSLMFKELIQEINETLRTWNWRVRFRIFAENIPRLCFERVLDEFLKPRYGDNSEFWPEPLDSRLENSTIQYLAFRIHCKYLNNCELTIWETYTYLHVAEAESIALAQVLKTKRTMKTYFPRLWLGLSFTSFSRC